MLQEIHPPDTARAVTAMSELRPHWTSVEAFVAHVDDVQRPEGHRLVGAFAHQDAREADAVLGFRVLTNLAWGRFVYVDDLTTRASARRQGWAGRPLDWVHGEAARLGSDEVHLDSGVGSARHDAHRLSLGTGYAITAHHFARPAD